MDIGYYRKLLDDVERRIVGIGITAFNRIGPALSFSNHEIVCYKWGSDLEALERLCPIHAIQRDFPEEDITKLNTLAILKHPGVTRYLQGLGKFGIFIYRTTERVDRLCEEHGWRVFANPHRIRDRFEDKRSFFKIVRAIGLPVIPGEQWEIDRVDEDEYLRLTKRVGERLVFQLTDFSLGGGKGTYFVNTLSDFKKFKRSAEERLETSELRFVNIVRYVEGVPASITGCVTRHGVLTAVVQTQVMDVPELVKLRERRGIWRGHDWSFGHYSSSIERQADRIAKRLGAYMYQDGYKGIFGVDLAIDKKTQKVYPVECNPRYTGGFPVYSFLQRRVEEIPLDVFQLLEFFDLNYKMDFAAMDASWKQPKEGAHLVLHNKETELWVQATGDLPAGVYRLKRSASSVKRSGFELEWVREGVTPLDIHEPNEFVFTDGCPKLGGLVKPHLRCGKLIFGRSILDGRYDRLNDWARAIVESVYHSLDLRPVATEEAGSSFDY